MCCQSPSLFGLCEGQEAQCLREYRMLRLVRDPIALCLRLELKLCRSRFLQCPSRLGTFTSQSDLVLELTGAGQLIVSLTFRFSVVSMYK